LTEIYPTLYFKHTTGMTHLRIMETLINQECRNNQNFSRIYFPLNYCTHDLRTQKPNIIILHNRSYPISRKHLQN